MNDVRIITHSIHISHNSEIETSECYSPNQGHFCFSKFNRYEETLSRLELKTTHFCESSSKLFHLKSCALISPVSHYVIFYGLNSYLQYMSAITENRKRTESEERKKSDGEKSSEIDVKQPVSKTSKH